jgi:hypothetical protein
LTIERAAFALFQRHEFHPALRTIARMISYDFGMHRAGVSLVVVLLLVVITRGADRSWVLTVRVLRDQCVSRQQRKYARDYDCNFFSHLV